MELSSRSQSALKRPILSQVGKNRVIQALDYKDHHYTHFIQPELHSFHSFGLEPSKKGMSNAKLNKDKLKRMREQKDAVTVNLGKKNKGEPALKQASKEITVHPSTAQEPVLSAQAPTSSVEVVEVVKAPLSSRVVDKAPTLLMDASLALRRAKSVVTKEDMDEYGNLNTNVVKRDLTHSLMKGLTEAMVVANRCIHLEEGSVKLKAELTKAMDANKSLTSVMAELTRERDHLADDLMRLRADVGAKDEELNKTVESYKKSLDQLKVLSEQMESARTHAVEEYKSSDDYDNNNTKYFFAGFELFRGQAKEKYPELDFDVFQPCEDDDFVVPVEEGDDAAALADP